MGKRKTVGKRYSFRHGCSVHENRFMKARGTMAMADCESEKTIGDAVAAWMTAPGEMRLHAGSVNVESSDDGAAHYLETAKHLNEYLNDHGTGR